MSILKFFRTLIVALNFIFIATGLFGYIWRPSFLVGGRSAPYWLVRLYSTLSLWSVTIILGLWLLVWLLAFLGRIALSNGDKTIQPLLGALRLALILAVIAGLPAMFARHSHIEAELYNSGSYNLLKETRLGQTNLLLVHCTDPGQLQCRPVERAAIYLPPEPTAMPTRVVVVEGVEVILKPDYIPTATPPVEFGIEATSGDLAVRVGETWNVLATPDTLPATPDPSE